jgi:DnaJ-class molecular chaperone
MDEKLPIPCDACHASGMRHRTVCSECPGKGYRLAVNVKQVLVQHPNQQRQQRLHQGQQRWHIR